jgi:hypothetical protein
MIKSGYMTIKGPVDAQRFLMIFDRIEKPFTIAWTQGEKRSIPQNSIMHMWFDEIAKHLGDRTLKDVKGQCHHMWALDVRLKDPQFAWVWQRTGALMSYEQQCNLLASETLGVSSRMSKAEMREYLEQIRAHYAQQGIVLKDPEEMR